MPVIMHSLEDRHRHDLRPGTLEYDGQQNKYMKSAVQEWNWPESEAKLDIYSSDGAFQSS